MPPAFNHQNGGTEHDRNVRHIEDPRPQGANPDVHEVDHHTIGDSIEQVGRTTRYQQSHTEEGLSGPAATYSDDGQAN
jgi:hypothetical protein